jgi:hypothetical protein
MKERYTRGVTTRSYLAYPEIYENYQLSIGGIVRKGHRSNACAA